MNGSFLMNTIILKSVGRVQAIVSSLIYNVNTYLYSPVNKTLYANRSNSLGCYLLLLLFLL